jgi:hypothetical protein
VTDDPDTGRPIERTREMRLAFADLDQGRFPDERGRTTVTTKGSTVVHPKPCSCPFHLETPGAVEVSGDRADHLRCLGCGARAVLELVDLGRYGWVRAHARCPLPTLPQVPQESH